MYLLFQLGKPLVALGRAHSFQKLPYRLVKGVHFHYFAAGAIHHIVGIGFILPGDHTHEATSNINLHDRNVNENILSMKKSFHEISTLTSALKNHGCASVALKRKSFLRHQGCFIFSYFITHVALQLAALK